MYEDLLGIIEKQIELDDRDVLKKKRAKRILDTYIEKQKLAVAAKFDYSNYDKQKRHRLNQKSILHARFIRNDLPPNFWAVQNPEPKDESTLQKEREFF